MRLPSSERELVALGDAIAKEEERRLARRDPSKLCPHSPHPKQQEFLDLEELEAMYGGAAGGGKSDALLMAYLQFVHVTGYAGLIMRRTYKDLALPGAIMDRAIEWFEGKWHWNAQDKRGTFDSGAILQFGYCDNATHLGNYKSAEFQFIAVDEVTEWPVKWYTFFFSRLRRTRDMVDPRTGKPVPLRMRSATNPDGIGAPWVRKRFDIAENAIVRDTRRVRDIVDLVGADEKPERVEIERVFVPARRVDNPSLDDSYKTSLSQLDAAKRRQLDEGRWSRDAGGLVYPYDKASNGALAAPTSLTPAALRAAASRSRRKAWTVLGIDYGYTNACAWVVVGWQENDPNTYILKAFKQEKLTPTEAAKVTREWIAEWRPIKTVGDVGGLGKGYAEEGRKRFKLPIEPADKTNKVGYQRLMAGALEDKTLKVVEAECRPLLDEWEDLPWNEERDGEAEGFPNHCSDGALYAWRESYSFTEETREGEPAPGSPEALEAYAAEAERKAERDLEAENRRDHVERIFTEEDEEEGWDWLNR